MRIRVFCAILSVVAALPSSLAAQVSSHLDWAWRQHGDATRWECRQEEIEMASGKKYTRGSTSAHLAMLYASRAQKHGDLTYAANWLLATQCHQHKNRQYLADHMTEALMYLGSQYGGRTDDALPPDWVPPGQPAAPKPTPAPRPPGTLWVNTDDVPRPVYAITMRMGTTFSCEDPSLRLVEWLAPGKPLIVARPKPGFATYVKVGYKATPCGNDRYHTWLFAQ